MPTGLDCEATLFMWQCWFSERGKIKKYIEKLLCVYKEGNISGKSRSTKLAEWNVESTLKIRPHQKKIIILEFIGGVGGQRGEDTSEKW